MVIQGGKSDAQKRILIKDYICKFIQIQIPHTLVSVGRYLMKKEMCDID